MALWSSPAQLLGSWCSKTRGFSFLFSPQSSRESPENPQEGAGIGAMSQWERPGQGQSCGCPPAAPSPRMPNATPGHPPDLWVRPGCSVPRAWTRAPPAIACSVPLLCPELVLPCSHSHGVAQPAQGPCRRCHGTAPRLGELRLLRAAETRDGNNLGKARGSATAPGDQAGIPAAAPGRPCRRAPVCSVPGCLPPAGSWVLSPAAQERGGPGAVPAWPGGAGPHRAGRGAAGRTPQAPGCRAPGCLCRGGLQQGGCG